MRRKNRASAGHARRQHRPRLAASRRLTYEPLEQRRLLTAAGDIDATFHFDGKAITDILGATQDDFGQAIAVQADGKILVAGNSFNGSTYDFAVARYNWNGSLDTTFSGDGMATVDFGFTNDFAYGIALQADGKIVVVGSNNLGVNFDFAVARFNADGSLDTTFSGDGKVSTVFGPGSHEARGVAIQADGKIVVGGYSNVGGTRDFAVVRFNANGSLDTTFDSDGKVTTSFGAGADEGYGLILQNDGRIVVAGQAHNGSNLDIALARYNTNGSLDTTFDGDGRVTTTIGAGDEQARAIALQADGKIVVAGSAIVGIGYDFALVRYNTNGSLDTTFDGDGKLTTAIGSSDDIANAITIRADGKILVAGSSFNGSNDDFAVARYNANGSLDTTFDSDGKLTTAVGIAGDVARSVAFQPDGRIVVAGYTRSSTHFDFALVRYWSELNGDLDDDWDVDADDIDDLWNRIHNGVDDPGANDNEDLNSDGLMNEDDLDYLLANLVYTTTFGKVVSVYGDADLDGGVGGLDFTAWRLRAGTGWAHGDFDGDGGIGGLDFSLWRTRPTAFPSEVGAHGSAGSATASVLSAPLAVPSTTDATQNEDTSASSQEVAATSPPAPSSLELAIDEALAASTMYRSRHLARGDEVSASDALQILLESSQ